MYGSEYYDDAACDYSALDPLLSAREAGGDIVS